MHLVRERVVSWPDPLVQAGGSHGVASGVDVVQRGLALVGMQAETDPAVLVVVLMVVLA